MNLAPDPMALVVTIGFIALGLSVIPIDRWLENRRRERRRNQAHRRLTHRRRFASWVRH